MKPILLLLACLAIPASAQNPWFNTPYAQLQSYLELTDAQLNSVLQNNADYARWLSEKQNRMAQVQLEIAQETAKSPLDPMALGVRYAEIETICRQIRDRVAALVTNNRALLNPAQQAKLQTLVDAVKLFPLVSEAQSVNILAGSAVPGVIGGVLSRVPLPGNIIPANRVGTGLLGVVSSAVAACPTTQWFSTSTFVNPSPLPNP